MFCVKQIYSEKVKVKKKTIQLFNRNLCGMWKISHISITKELQLSMNYKYDLNCFSYK